MSKTFPHHAADRKANVTPRRDMSASADPSKASSPPAISAASLKSRLRRVERTPDGFFPSFDVNDATNWGPFLNTHGFVIVQILTKAECDATVADFVADVNARAAQGGCNPSTAAAPGSSAPPRMNIDINDPMTWEDGNWPCAGRHLVGDFPALTQRAMANRTHPNVYRFYQQLLRSDRILCHVDCWGVMRGTAQLRWPLPPGDSGMGTAPPAMIRPPPADAKAAAEEEEEHYYIDRPEWRSHLAPHWDVHPWWYVKERAAGRPPMFQGVLALVDCPDDVGGFCVAAGSSALLPEWCTKVPEQKAARAKHFDLPSNDDWYDSLQHVPLRAGEMVVWDSGSLHANFANFGPSMRIVQYLRCLTRESAEGDAVRAVYLPENTQAKWGVEYARLPYALPPLSRRMLGLDPWP